MGRQRRPLQLPAPNFRAILTTLYKFARELSQFRALGSVRYGNQGHFRWPRYKPNNPHTNRVREGFLKRCCRSISIFAEQR
jgi:hypothetical protein